MATTLRSERFENATIDLKDMTITEYGRDYIRPYSLSELLNRWDGIVGITLTIDRNVPLPPDGRDI